MDNVTHTLFAATLARTPLARAGRGTTAALLLASNAPDIDIVAAAGGGLEYLTWHRGPTHGPLGVIGLGLATAGFVWTAQRLFDRRPETNPASFAALAAVSMLGVLLHILMDLPTVYGTRVLSPFSGRWFSVDWMPIIDVYLWAILGGGLLADGLQRFRARRAVPAVAIERARYWNAVIVLTLMLANYGLRAAAHGAALAEAPAFFGPTLPTACPGSSGARRIVESWSGGTAGVLPASGDALCLMEMAAIPSFTSPFEWRVLARVSNAYLARTISVWNTSQADETARSSQRYPDEWTPIVLDAARSEVARTFLDFARFPAARSLTEADGTTTVQWTDLRFAGGISDDELAAQRSDLFTVTVRIAPDGRIVGSR